MGTRLVLKIKRRTLSQWLTLMLVMMPFAFGSLIHLLHVPSAVKYTLDVAWVILLVTMYCYQKALPIRKEKKLIAWTLLFFVCTLLAYLPLFQSGLYYLWGGRNLFRFYVAFFAFALLLSQEDVERTMKWFDRLFWVNFVVSLIQYYIYGYKWDYLGGIFGVEQGCNGYTNLFFSIVLTKSVVLYMEKKEKLWLSLAKFSAAMVVAALAELKFFFVEAILIVVLAALFTNFTWRKLLLIIGCLTAVVIGAALLTLVFPHLAGWFSLNWFWETATSDVGYTGSGDLNRLTAIPQINELWLTHWSQRIFGSRTGYCIQRFCVCERI